MDRGIEILFGSRGPCNYDCHYCVGRFGASVKKPVLYDMKWLRNLYQRLSETDGPGTFIFSNWECGNSEPTIHPQVKETLALQVEHGSVNIPTNGSIPPKQWLPSKYPRRIRVIASLHPRGETDLEGFLGRMKEISSRGVRLTIQFIAHPLNIPKIEKYQEFFGSHDKKLFIRRFRGPYEDKFYPRDYTAEERRIVGLPGPHEVKKDVGWNRRIYHPTRNFQGIPCLAGHRYVCTLATAHLRRCLYVNKHLDGPLDGPTPCPLSGCPCGLLLEELNYYTKGRWLGYKRAAGWPGTPPSGPRVPRDRMREYKEKQNAYFNLMLKYGKIDQEGNLLVGTGLSHDPYQDTPPPGIKVPYID